MTLENEINAPAYDEEQNKKTYFELWQEAEEDLSKCIKECECVE